PEGESRDAKVGSELVPSLGQVLDQPLDAKGRALVLDWSWSRSRDRLDGLSGNPSACGTPADARLLGPFRLRACARTQGPGGGGVLAVSGDPPAAPGTAVITELTGWGGHHTDRTAPADLLSGVAEITLTQFPDPTAIFDGWQGGSATVVVTCAEGCPWR